MEWYYANRNGEQVKFSEEEFPQLVGTGAIARTTLVWNATMPDWQAAGIVKPEQFALGAPGGVPSPYLAPSSAVYAQPDPTQGLQITALVCGILSCVCCGALTALPAIICGHIARSKMVALTGSTQGTGKALAGLILGYVGIGLTVIGVVLEIVLGGIEMIQ